LVQFDLTLGCGKFEAADLFFAQLLKFLLLSHCNLFVGLCASFVLLRYLSSIYSKFNSVQSTLSYFHHRIGPRRVSRVVLLFVFSFLALTYRPA